VKNAVAIHFIHPDERPWARKRGETHRSSSLPGHRGVRRVQGLTCLFWLQLAIALLLIWGQPARAQEDPYFATDHHHLPEAGDLSFADYSVFGMPKAGNDFLGSQIQIEYRIKKWWSTEVQISGQTTWNDSTVFTGYTWTNKFKLTPTNHWVNLALSIGWEDGNAADKCIAEMEGHGTKDDFALSNGGARNIQEHEVETKLILSRDYKGWNFAGNVVAVKNLAGAPWEFGYSLGASRALSTSDSKGNCVFCRNSVSAGLEFYGGLGDAHSLGLQQTAHYLGPGMSWKLSDRLAIKVGPHFGLTPQSQHVVVHLGVIYDIPEFNKSVRRLLDEK
jgi:hypothetical protein